MIKTRGVLAGILLAGVHLGAQLVRQRTLPSDPQGGFRPDEFYNVSSVSFYVTRKF